MFLDKYIYFEFHRDGLPCSSLITRPALSLTCSQSIVTLQLREVPEVTLDYVHELMDINFFVIVCQILVDVRNQLFIEQKVKMGDSWDQMMVRLKIQKDTKCTNQETVVVIIEAGTDLVFRKIWWFRQYFGLVNALFLDVAQLRHKHKNKAKRGNGEKTQKERSSQVHLGAKNSEKRRQIHRSGQWVLSPDVKIHRVRQRHKHGQKINRIGLNFMQRCERVGFVVPQNGTLELNVTIHGRVGVWVVLYDMLVQPYAWVTPRHQQVRTDFVDPHVIGQGCVATFVLEESTNVECQLPKQRTVDALAQRRRVDEPLVAAERIQ